MCTAWTPLLPPSPAHPPPHRRQNRRQGATAAALASAVEWYDYFVFGIAAALVLGDLYFPAGSSTAGVLASFATFAVGFLARPFGGIVAGHLGDKRGRKPMLVLALTLMGVATTGIGLLPTYETIGIAAPILLVTLRVMQGIAVGAQWGGAMLLATEYAPEGKRGIYGSFVQLGVPIGVVTANSVFLLAGAFTSESAFAAWGWRLPFLVGLLVLVLAWYIHTHVEETPEFREAERALAEKEKAEKGQAAEQGEQGADKGKGRRRAELPAAHDPARPPRHGLPRGRLLRREHRDLLHPDHRRPRLHDPRTRHEPRARSSPSPSASASPSSS